ncbi:hypothetical protein H6G80_24430 [Nostoc sp. FACHB-87]|uniref:hypothetical protein n=1 Tax=Nostocales TaxID=1161 RepID=UPI001688F47D|nr:MULTISPECIES: hypothetical protein [Nostocales]MBD2457210.1 hypothetical protein [Nostoc sp. FACHB-87]MBD2478300.1 hypothetical protein [Anabaena sp. FACHB-83]MBD2487849.1 hypothetical protein [Aulosira sp. FACHB-615]
MFSSLFVSVFMRKSADNHISIKPVHQIWTDSAVPWAYIAVDLPSFPRNRDV